MRLVCLEAPGQVECVEARRREAPIAVPPAGVSKCPRTRPDPVPHELTQRAPHPAPGPFGVPGFQLDFRAGADRRERGRQFARLRWRRGLGFPCAAAELEVRCFLEDADIREPPSGPGTSAAFPAVPAAVSIPYVSPPSSPRCNDTSVIGRAAQGLLPFEQRLGTMPSVFRCRARTAGPPRLRDEKGRRLACRVPSGSPQATASLPPRARPRRRLRSLRLAGCFERERFPIRFLQHSADLPAFALRVAQQHELVAGGRVLEPGRREPAGKAVGHVSGSLPCCGVPRIVMRRAGGVTPVTCEEIVARMTGFALRRPV